MIIIQNLMFQVFFKDVFHLAVPGDKYDAVGVRNMMLMWFT